MRPLVSLLVDQAKNAVMRQPELCRRSYQDIELRIQLLVLFRPSSSGQQQVPYVSTCPLQAPARASNKSVNHNNHRECKQASKLVKFTAAYAGLSVSRALFVLFTAGCQGVVPVSLLPVLCLVL